MVWWTAEGLWSLKQSLNWKPAVANFDVNKQTEQQYKPATKYQPGAANPTDYKSQHSNSPAAVTSEEEMIAEEYVNFITDEIITKHCVEKKF